MSTAGERRKVRLCLLTPTHWLAFMGGAQYQVKCLLEALLPLDRYDIYCIARRVPPEFTPEGYRLLRIEGPAQRRLGMLMDAPALQRLLGRIRPDVIYQRVGCGHTGLAAHYARRNGCRLIWHVAHDDEVTPGKFPGAAHALYRFLEKRSIEYAIRHAGHIVAQTAQQAELLRAHYGRQVDAVVPNFHPAPTETLDKRGPPTVLWVANLKPWKRPETFVQLAEALRDLPWARFVMVGARAKARNLRRWDAALMERIRRSPNLEYLGPKSQDEVNALLAKAHVFVNTSLNEGFANTFIQAWMRRVPVVSRHVNPDGVLEREGIGIHARSDEELGQSVRDLLEDPARRASYGQRAQKYALRNHSLANARMIEALIEGRTERTAAQACALPRRSARTAPL